MTEQEAARLLSLIPEVKPLLTRKIADTFGSFSAYFHCDLRTLAPELRAPAKYYHRHRQQMDEQLAAEMRSLLQRKIKLIPLTGDDYPSLLKEIHSPPPLLFVRGDANALSLPQIAIVGRRRASRWSKRNDFPPPWRKAGLPSPAGWRWALTARLTGARLRLERPLPYSVVVWTWSIQGSTPDSTRRLSPGEERLSVSLRREPAR